MPDAAKKLIEQIAETEKPLFSLSNALFAVMTQLQPGDDVRGPHIIGALRSLNELMDHLSEWSKLPHVQ
jgi:hypothetical protein